MSYISFVVSILSSLSIPKKIRNSYFISCSNFLAFNKKKVNFSSQSFVALDVDPLKYLPFLYSFSPCDDLHSIMWVHCLI